MVATISITKSACTKSVHKIKEKKKQTPDVRLNEVEDLRKEVNTSIERCELYLNQQKLLPAKYCKDKPIRMNNMLCKLNNMKD